MNTLFPRTAPAAFCERALSAWGVRGTLQGSADPSVWQLMAKTRCCVEYGNTVQLNTVAVFLNAFTLNECKVI